MPNARVPSKLVDTATSCLDASPPPWTNQSLAMRALAMVSWVVKVLLTITNMVVLGFNPDNTDSTWAPSTLLTK